MKKIFYLFLFFALVVLASCKKDKKTTVIAGPSKAGTTLQLIQDSIYLYAKEDYLWYDALPDYATFNPRGTAVGSSDVATLQNEIDNLSQYKINPTTGLPYEYYAPAPGEAKYSFIDDGTVTAELNGVKGDFGFAPFYNTTADLRIKYVYPGSPAGLAGIKRGYQITSINGNTNLTYDGNTTSTNVNFIINAYAYSSTITMTLLRPDGTTMNVSLATAGYNVNPVLKDSIYTTGNGHKVGYVVFNSFVSDAVADPIIDPIFANFAANGVTDVVVDLRYNGGGYVSTAEHIDNLLVPAAKTGTLMYNTYYNTTLQNGKEVLLQYQTRKDPSSGQDYNYAQFSYTVADNAVNFAKAGSLNISRVFFIVTGATASASELTINNLRPFLDVQFIGNTSYGKPVGFFNIDINKYEMFIPEFYVENSAGQGDYYSGFTPGAAGTPGIADNDDVTKDFGDPTEGLLAHALNYVTKGTYTVAQQPAPIISGNRLSVKQQNSFVQKSLKHNFMGMIFNKKMRRKK